MAFRTQVLPALFVLRWEIQPMPADMPLVLAAAAAAAASGAPMAFLTLIGADTRPPEGEARLLLSEMTPRLVAHFKADCLVIEGTGLISETKRLFTRAMLAMSGLRAPLFASASDALLGSWCPTFLDGKAALSALKQSGMIG